MIPAPLQNADCLFLSKENPDKVGYAALAVVAADKLVPLCEEFLAAGYHLEDVSGLISSDGAVSMYHFAHFDTPGRAAVMVIAPAEKPVFPSIAAVYHGAEWHERETRDFFGFRYEGNPNFIPLLLAETMADVHPLLKDESSRATLASIFSAEGREREVVKQADGFTLFDVPVKEEPAPTPAEAPEPGTAAPKAVEAKAAEAPKADAPQSGPEASTPPDAVKAAPAPAEAPKPEAGKADEPSQPEPAAMPAPSAKESAPANLHPKTTPAASSTKTAGSVKKGKAGKSGKKGTGNA